jgi:Ca2+-binding RTX toxin-like protein
MSNTVGGGMLADLISYGGAYVAENVTIGSTGDVAIHGTGSHHAVTALGDIFGAGYAIQFEEDESGEGNSVLIGANSDITGYAAGLSNGIGIGIVGIDSRIENRGSIFGMDTGIYLNTAEITSGSDQSTIVNKGTIDGLSLGINHQSDEMLIIRNTGTIEGGDMAVFGSFNVEKVVNKGEIVGDVELAGGDDLYNGRKAGMVDGTVSGGSGHDMLIGGSGDDWLNGGYDKDTLTGGAGSDEFHFNSSLFGAADADVITDFKVADDVIALDHDIFAALGKNLDPTIVKAAHKPPNAGNHIIVYNDPKGTLSYDSDGKGSGHAIVFAQLDPHLDLTASNFLLI